eukprot:TRINITY_DN1246_c0_g3_i4.p1 TRINITY_DN1246_c0_g3~~TRINITY_DN1246_c0_g3_i4.p1  ORF type:complete len:144 (-),score=8.88 TRINITY_DN1246_c0_g3_i4:495-926(-)
MDLISGAIAQHTIVLPALIRAASSNNNCSSNNHNGNDNNNLGRSQDAYCINAGRQDAGRRIEVTLYSACPCKTLLTLWVPDPACPYMPRQARRMQDSNAGRSTQDPAIRLTAVGYQRLNHCLQSILLTRDVDSGVKKNRWSKN